MVRDHQDVKAGFADRAFVGRRKDLVAVRAVMGQDYPGYLSNKLWAKNVEALKETFFGKFMGETRGYDPGQNRVRLERRRQGHYRPSEGIHEYFVGPKVLEKAINLSASQNIGKAAVSRFCQPEFKICTIALSFVQRNGKDGFMNGKTVGREICELNEFREVQNCVDFSLIGVPRKSAVSRTTHSH